ncbi:MAG TPA: sortase [Candidatus Limnocylindrales bacterium]|nr:sortase [Candidatus Limnocylindrales bacterium]
MSSLYSFRNRLLPAILTAVGVSLIAGGLLTYTGAVEPSLEPDASETIVQVSPTPVPSLVLPTIPPPGTAEPSPSPSIPADRVATRVVVPALKIDLPVVEGPPNRVLCNVAMYAEAPGLVQPGFPGSVYLYGHARKGMFLPLLDQSKKKNGAGMLNMLVEVYTSDDQRLTYYITEVRRHVPKTSGFNDPLSRKTETLWLQTSEGPKGTPTVLQVIAEPFGSGPADHAAAHPTPKPVVCT